MSEPIVFINGIYPVLSETFIFDQFRALRQSGLAYALVSARRPKPEQVHPHMRDNMAEVDYLLDAPWSRVARALFSLLLRHPIRLFRCLAQTLTMEERLPASLAHIVGAALVIHRYGPRCWLHSHFTYSSAAICLWAKRLAGLPFSMTLHGADLTFDHVPDLARKLAAADRLVSISQHNLTYIEQHYADIDLHKAIVIPLGVHIGDAPRPKSPRLEADRPLRLLNVGRLSDHKAQHVLIDACARLRDRGIDFQCEVIGEGPKRQLLEQRIREAGLEDRVKLLGKRYHHEVFEHLSECDLFVMTSVVEGMPIALMEAMSLGVPVIATRVGGIPELLADGECGLLFEPGDDQQLAELVARIAHGEIDAAMLAQRAWEYLEHHFDLFRNSQRFAQYLLECHEQAYPPEESRDRA